MNNDQRIVEELARLSREIERLKRVEVPIIPDYGTWQSWTPVIASGTGAITSYTSNGVYCVIGGLVFVNFSFTITNKGTAAGSMTVGLPVVAGRLATGVARENALNGMLHQLYITANSMRIWDYKNADPVWANNMTFHGNVFYAKG